MSDVLERLEAWAAYAEGSALPTCSPVTGREAIAEIERLRGEIVRLRPLQWSPMNAYDEIERLRGLLWEAIQSPDIYGDEPETYDWIGRVREALGDE